MFLWVFAHHAPSPLAFCCFAFIVMRLLPKHNLGLLISSIVIFHMLLITWSSFSLELPSSTSPLRPAACFWHPSAITVQLYIHGYGNMRVWLNSIMLGTSAYQTDYTVVFLWHNHSAGIPRSWIQSTTAPKTIKSCINTQNNPKKKLASSLSTLYYCHVSNYILKALFATFFRVIEVVDFRPEIVYCGGLRCVLYRGCVDDCSCLMLIPSGSRGKKHPFKERIHQIFDLRSS